MNKKKIFYVFLFSIIVILLAIFVLNSKIDIAQSDKTSNFGIVATKNIKNKTLNQDWSVNKNKECISKIEKRTVRGNSMTPFIKDGDVVNIDFNYYQCYGLPQRNDVIIHDFKARDMDLIKIIKVIPGDKFKVNSKNSTLLVNDKEIKNKEDKIYKFTKKNIKMLSLYERDFNGIMPDGMYFIFGDKTGSVDSSKFGPISLESILGKVIIN